MVEKSCDRGDPNALGALFCEETCDDILGGFCPNENGYQDCNTNGCPGKVHLLNYRVSHVLEDLGWVDLDLGCSTILLGQ